MSYTIDSPVADIDLGNLCSKRAYAWAEKTFKNAQKDMGAPIEGLRGSYANVISFSGVNLAIASDGIGTKIDVAERMGIYNTLGFDLIAMIVDDLVCVGAKPTTISNILDVDHLNLEIVDGLMSGLSDAANYAGVAVTGGEIAELGSRIGGYGSDMHFNWCATGIGVVDNVIDGSKIKENDVIISLQSPGFRSNGFSMARNILKNKFGDDWHKGREGLSKTWGEALLTPSLIYSPLIATLSSEGIRPSGIAHITGGGIAENLSRILKMNKCGAILSNLFEPNEEMLILQHLGNLSEDAVYRQWNMGNGMLLVVPEDDAARVLEHASRKEYKAKAAGVITSSKVIELHSLGEQAKVLRYEL